MPVTEGLAAFGAANASPRYALANSQEMVANLTQQAALINGLDNGISPSPFGSSHPDLTRDPDPAERNAMLCVVTPIAMCKRLKRKTLKK